MKTDEDVLDSWTIQGEGKRVMQKESREGGKEIRQKRRMGEDSGVGDRREKYGEDTNRREREVE